MSNPESPLPAVCADRWAVAGWLSVLIMRCEMAIRMQDPGDPAGQAEVRGRIRSLVDAVRRQVTTVGPDADAQAAADSRLREEVVAFYIAVTGVAPLHQHQQEMLGVDGKLTD